MSKMTLECPTTESAEAEMVARALVSPCKDDQQLLLIRMSQYVGMLRAMHLWFHGAHNVVRGAGFAGDHVNLFGKIYLAIQDEIDGAIEKAIGVTGDENLGCPAHITKTAAVILSKYPSPHGISSLAMASVGLEMERHYIEMLETMFEELDDAGLLSLGLNDHLAASANVHESNMYLLKQRIKTFLED